MKLCAMTMAIFYLPDKDCCAVPSEARSKQKKRKDPEDFFAVRYDDVNSTYIGTVQDTGNLYFQRSLGEKVTS